MIKEKIKKKKKLSLFVFMVLIIGTTILFNSCDGSEDRPLKSDFFFSWVHESSPVVIESTINDSTLIIATNSGMGSSVSILSISNWKETDNPNASLKKEYPYGFTITGTYTFGQSAGNPFESKIFINNDRTKIVSGDNNFYSSYIKKTAFKHSKLTVTNVPLNFSSLSVTVYFSNSSPSDYAEYLEILSSGIITSAISSEPSVHLAWLNDVQSGERYIEIILSGSNEKKFSVINFPDDGNTTINWNYMTESF
jgi:hypothetical protein